jgi:serine/threonine protein kinase
VFSAAPQRTRHLAPGDKLGKYEVIRQIAVGGMAELYLARTLGIEGFEKLVVLKRILPQYVSNATFVNMFLNEARLAATLHHPNVAQVYDIGLDEGDYFFAMEYVHGEDLDHISMASEEQGVPLSMDAALTLVAGLCAGLHYAHEKMSAEGKPLNIVHRDVSPSNVLVSYDGAVKLVDFGIARASSRPGTTQGGLKGKIQYMSPEQCRAHAQLDRRSDLYSVGAILYELTTGKLPFGGETEYQVLNQIVNEDVPPPSRVVPGYPAHLEQIVLKALARNVEQRYSTALQLQADVEDFAHESRLRISPLVLARIMGTLFPARLEEWDHAKAQGAFFVEQHVVRTLIESGKTPDPTDPETVAQLAAMADAQARQDAAAKAAEAALRQFGDDDTTALNQQSFSDVNDTMVGGSPMSAHEPTFDRVTEVSAVPLPPTPTVEAPAYQPPTYDDESINIPSPPDPRPPQQYPIVSQLMNAAPGSLVTSAGKYGGLPANEVTQTIGEVTERVRVPQRRHTSPTTFVRTTSRKAALGIIALVAAAGAIAAFIALRGGNSEKRSAPAAAEESVQMPVHLEAQPEQQAVEVGPAPAQPPAVDTPATRAEPKQVTDVAPATKTEQATKTEPAAKRAPVAKTEPKPLANTPKPVTLEPKPVTKLEPKPVTKLEPKPVAKIEPKPVTKTEPKQVVAPKQVPKKTATPPKKVEPKPTDKSWNADSPFMPVRPEKKP